MITDVLLEHPWLTPTGPVLLAGVATRRPVAALLAGSGLSAALEAAQAVLPVLGRSCDTNDWVCNTIGAVIGAVLAWLALRLSRVGAQSGPAGGKHVTR